MLLDRTMLLTLEVRDEKLDCWYDFANAPLCLSVFTKICYPKRAFDLSPTTTFSGIAKTLRSRTRVSPLEAE